MYFLSCCSSHIGCVFCVVFLLWLTLCYSFCIGYVFFMLVLLFVTHWYSCLIALVMFIAHWCSCSSMLVFLPFPHWYCYAHHVNVIAFPTLVLLILSHRWCYPSCIVLLFLSHWSYYFYCIHVDALVTLVLLFLSHRFFHIGASCSRTYWLNFYCCSFYVGVDFVSLVSLVFPPFLQCVSWSLEHRIIKRLWG